MNTDTSPPARLPADPLPRHLDLLHRRWTDALGHHHFDCAVIAAGQSRPYFLDDQAPPFRANPHFQQWFPSDACEGSLLLIRPGQRPRLFFLKPDDYWHQPPELPEWAHAHFEISEHADAADVEQAALASAAGAGRHCAWISEQPVANQHSGQLNPQGLLDELHYLRACKSDFEIGCMREATRSAVLGHEAARALFESGRLVSEFELNLAYLAGAATTAGELPYASIVALNQHAGVLHYQHYDRQPPATARSFLIDAGARCNGYASDITRTYAAHLPPAPEIFHDLLKAMNAAQLDLIATIRPGLSFLELHIDMHRRLATILTDSGILRCSATSAFESGLTESFFPHGLGHLIGLQTHDVGGQQKNPAGDRQPPPENYPSLRLTRTLTPGTVVTIEPGLYFIPKLLDALKAGPQRNAVNWPALESLRPCGGIRIEDNVLITEKGTDNLTRTAFQQVQAQQ
ncbi:MAG: Xaa-Pro dipeptidase [Pseudomonadales bacterium]